MQPAVHAGAGRQHHVVARTAAPQACHECARLAGDERAGRQVPRREPLFEVGVGPPGGHRAEIKGTRAEPADVTDRRQQVGEQPGLRGPPPLVVPEAGADERLAQILDVGATQGHAVEHRAAAPDALPQLALGRVEDHSDNRSASHLDPDRHRPLWDAVEEVHGAVDRVDDPGRTGPRRAGRALLAEHAVRRPPLCQRLEQQPLDRLVGSRHDVGGARLGALDRDAGPHRQGERAGLAGQLGGEGKGLVEVHGRSLAAPGWHDAHLME